MGSRDQGINNDRSPLYSPSVRGEEKGGSHKFPALILAAGLSTRMGFPKLMLARRGIPLIAIMADRLKHAGLGRLAIVISDTLLADFILRHVNYADILYNDRPELGMISSIRIGLDWAGDDAKGILTWPVDHPLVSLKTLELLKKHAASDNICRPSYQDRNGHPTWWGKTSWPFLRSQFADNGAKPVLRMPELTVNNLRTEDNAVLLNINTPEEALLHGLTRYNP